MKWLRENATLTTWTCVCFGGGLVGSFVGGILSRLIGGA